MQIPAKYSVYTSIKAYGGAFSSKNESFLVQSDPVREAKMTKNQPILGPFWTLAAPLRLITCL